jgi:tryptophan-rich sensory protein
MIKKSIVFILSIAGSFAAGAIGSLATIPNIPSWYASLEKPALNPPNWVFGPVWSILYVLIGVSLALVILEASKRSKKKSYIWFGVQLILNTLWSLVFFGLHSPWLGVIVIIALITSIVLAVREFYRINKYSAWLLAPYLAWVCFATYVTVGVTLLN